MTEATSGGSAASCALLPGRGDQPPTDERTDCERRVITANPMNPMTIAAPPIPLVSRSLHPTGHSAWWPIASADIGSASARKPTPRSDSLNGALSFSLRLAPLELP